MMCLIKKFVAVVATIAIWGVLAVQVQANENEIDQPTVQLESVVLESVVVEGSTIFKSSDFAPIIAPYLNREVSYEELVELADKLTELYRQEGYETSRVYLLEQDLEEGKIVYQIVEGQLVKTTITGLDHLQESYVRDRLEAASGPPLSQERLKEALLLLEQSPLIEKLEASFDPGVVQGESELSVNITEAPRWQIGIQGDNYDNPQFGEAGLTLYAGNINLLGFGDNFQYNEKFVLNGENRRFISYSFPINPQDGILQISYRNEDVRIVEEPIENIGIAVDSTAISISFAQPLLRKPNSQFELGVSFDLRRSEAFFFNNQPYPIYDGSLCTGQKIKRRVAKGDRKRVS